jgi:putative OPT family oligopeptide transporter
MTIAALMATSLIFLGIGWTGDVYQPIALVVGSIVCIAAANAGATSQDLKTGYIVGATPIYQQIGLIIGVLAATLSIGFTLILMNNTLGIGEITAAHPHPLSAPQATLMATVIKGLLSNSLPWALVLIGMAIAAVVELCGVSSLAFAVGAYLPLSSSTPIFIGGLVKWIVEKFSRNKENADSEIGLGALFSSGLIAGGALTGILIAVMIGTNVGKNADGSNISLIDKFNTGIGVRLGNYVDLVSIIAFMLLAFILLKFGLSNKKEN